MIEPRWKGVGVCGEGRSIEGEVLDRIHLFYKVLLTVEYIQQKPGTLPVHIHQF